MNLAISVDNLSKAYQLGQFGTGTISRDLERWWITTVRGKEDPFLKIGEQNDRSRKGESDIVWALHQVSFEVKQGEVLGIIGKNGAGKSTLLKVLSRTTSPTKGEIKIKGRIASLLEVGTGFHPELTGRENIFLNGAILGMTTREIRKKFDEIVDFSGVERYINTPVKRYSSGMYVRLAFAVAAHLEPEILVVDEVLAVGDAEFQNKCLGKMKDVSVNEGRTVLFVSHNMAAISQLCTSGLLLNNGTPVFHGSAKDAIEQYTTEVKQIAEVYEKQTASDYTISKVSILNKDGRNVFDFQEEVVIQVEVRIGSDFSGLSLGIALIDKWKRKLFTTTNTIKKNSPSEFSHYTIHVPKELLLAGFYTIDISTFVANGPSFCYLQDICGFEVTDYTSGSSIYGSADVGVIHVNCEWR